MTPVDFLNLATQLMLPLCMILGLGIAARWRADVNAWLEQIGAGSFASNRAGQLIVWIALGVLFGDPLADLLGTLAVVIRLWLGPAANIGSMSTVWGTESFAVYSVIGVLMTLVVYVLVVGVGYRLWPAAANGQGEANTTLALEEWFVLFAAADLVNRFVRGIIQSLIWLPVPNSVEMGRLSSVGFLGAWLLGLVVVAVILLVLLNSIRKTPVGA